VQLAARRGLRRQQRTVARRSSQPGGGKKWIKRSVLLQSFFSESCCLSPFAFSFCNSLCLMVSDLFLSPFCAASTPVPGARRLLARVDFRTEAPLDPRRKSASANPQLRGGAGRRRLRLHGARVRRRRRGFLLQRRDGDPLRGSRRPSATRCSKPGGSATPMP